MSGARRRKVGGLVPVLAPVPALVLLLAIAAPLGGFGCEKKSQAAEARDLFTSTCARCHGADGKGGLAVIGGLPPPRNFHDHEFQQTHTDAQIRHTIVNGKGTGMPGFGATFSDEQLVALIAHVRSFDIEKGTATK
jgi:mono/diheme cytochrome c family protein